MLLVSYLIHDIQLLQCQAISGGRHSTITIAGMTADVKYGGGGHVAGVAAGGAGGGAGVQFDMIHNDRIDHSNK